MDIDIDSNGGDEHLIYGISDDRFSIVVWVSKARFRETIEAISAIAEGGGVVLGTIGCGERVWVVRDEAGYSLAVGDADSKDIRYGITGEALGQLLAAEPGELRHGHGPVDCPPRHIPSPSPAVGENDRMP